MAKSKKIPPVLPQPERHDNVSQNAKWLAGQGAGSWFVIMDSEATNNYVVNRLSPDGKLECEGVFNASSAIDLNADFEVTYPSHCAEVTVKQEERLITLKRS